MGPTFQGEKGLDRPEIGLDAKLLAQISGVLLLIPACIYENYVVFMISDAWICPLNM